MGSWILILQWLAIPLVLAYYFALWKKQSAALVSETGESRTADESRLSYVKRVFSSLGYVEWGWFSLITMFLIFLVFTIASHLL